MASLKLKEFPQSATRVLREALSGEPLMLRTGNLPHNVSGLLKMSAGIVILEEIKVGLVAGVKLGRGILLKKVKQDDDKVTWSAPLYLRAREYSAGLTIGVDKVEALLLLTEEGVKHYSEALLQFDIDVNAVTISNKTHKFLSDAMTLLHEDKCNVAFVLEKGVMYDLSLAGLKVFPDQAKNKKEYGENVTSAEILSGAIPFPESLFPLAEELKSLMEDQGAESPAEGTGKLNLAVKGNEVEVEREGEEGLDRDVARVRARAKAELQAQDAQLRAAEI